MIEIFIGILLSFNLQFDINEEQSIKLSTKMDNIEISTDPPGDIVVVPNVDPQ